MTRHSISATYAIETQGPLHIGTGQGVAGLHRAMLRDQHGLPFIPGSTIKGRARYAAIRLCEWLKLPVSKESIAGVQIPGSRLANGPQAKPDLPERIFGTAWSRCTLRFSDARAEKAIPDTDPATHGRLRERGYGLRELRTGTGRSRRLGTVGQGLLFQSEVAAPGLILRGEIHGTLECKDLFDQPVEALILWLALHLMIEDGVGGNKSAGSGKLAFAPLSRLEMKVEDTPFDPPDDDTFAAVLALLSDPEVEGGTV